MRGQAPRRIGLKHVVLQDVVPGVHPVVRDLALVMITHDIRTTPTGGIVGPATHRAPPFLLGNEAVHPSPVDVCQRIRLAVGTPVVHVASVVKWPYALLAHRIGDTHRRHAVPHRDAVGTGKRPEVTIERTILLHDDDDVVDPSLCALDLTSEIRSAEVGGPPCLGDRQREHRDERQGERTLPRACSPVGRPATLQITSSPLPPQGLRCRSHPPSVEPPSPQTVARPQLFISL
jgi:hypothetical protein